MNEALCPLIKDACMKEGCLWYAEGVKKCAVVALGILVNNMHDLGVATYKQCVESSQDPR
jgi:hypothetical protein